MCAYVCVCVCVIKSSTLDSPTSHHYQPHWPAQLPGISIFNLFGYFLNNQAIYLLKGIVLLKLLHTYQKYHAPVHINYYYHHFLNFYIYNVKIPSLENSDTNIGRSVICKVLKSNEVYTIIMIFIM